MLWVSSANHVCNTKFEVITAEFLMIWVFWDVMPCFQGYSLQCLKGEGVVIFTKHQGI